MNDTTGEFIEYNHKNGPPQVTRLVPNKPDAELAEEIKNELLKAYQPILDVLTKAHRLGFIVQVNVNLNALGKIEINQLKILKDFPLQF